jgi:hypothetical protein
MTPLIILWAFGFGTFFTLGLVFQDEFKPKKGAFTSLIVGAALWPFVAIYTLLEKHK